MHRFLITIVFSAFLLITGYPLVSEAEETVAVCRCVYIPGTETNQRTASIPLGPPLAPDLPATQEQCTLSCQQLAESANSGVVVTAELKTASVAPPSQPATTPEIFVIPKLNVAIPGLTFSKPLRVNGKLNVNFLGEYLVGIYRWLVGVAMVFAVIMIIVGGVQYTVSGGQSGVEAAKDRIKNALIGVVILLASFLLLNVTNPQLTMFRPLQLAEQPPILEESEEAEVSGATLATSFTAPQTANIVGAGAKDVPSDLTPAVESAANELAEDDYGMHITSSFRTPEKQVELIIKNCQNPPGSATCNPKPGRPGTCMMRGNDPARCPHTSGHALDIWATGKNCVSSQATCQANLTTCRNNPCQAALISAMRNNGFCNLASEPWHFENPKMSSTCN